MYQGGTFSLKTIFVRGKPVEPKETRVILDDESHVDGRMENSEAKIARLAAHKFYGPKYVFNNAIVASRTKTITTYRNQNTTPHMTDVCGNTMHTISTRFDSRKFL